MNSISKKKLVSVIIPTHCGSNVIKRAIDSVLRQTYDNIEIIVVDDNGIGTKEQIKTSEKLKEYGNNKRIKYICHEVNKNGSAARNTGVDYASGEYISLLDDDDEFYEEKIEKLLNLLEALPKEYVLVFGNSDGYCGGKLKYSNKAHVPDRPLYNILLHRYSIGTSAFLMRKEAYDSLGGFDKDFKRHQDWEFFARVIANYKIEAINTPASIRHLVDRHSITSADELVRTRLFYIERMKPYIGILAPKEQKDIVIYNTLDVLIKYISEHQYKKFILEYICLHPGLRGILFFLRRFMLFLKR